MDHFILLYLLIVIVMAKNFRNYELKEQKVYDFTIQLKSKIVNDYFFPNDNTLLVKTKDSIEMINIKEPQFSSSISVGQGKQAFLGTQISLIYNNTHANALDNSGLPTYRYSSIDKNNGRMINVAWKDVFYVLSESNKIYQYSNGVFKYSSIDMNISKNPLAIIDIKYSKIIVFNDRIIQFIQPNTSTQIHKGNLTNNIQCYKIYTQNRSEDNHIIQKMIFRQSNNLFLYRRHIYMQNQTIINITNFQMVNSILDTSFECNFNIIDPQILIFFNSSSFIIAFNLSDSFNISFQSQKAKIFQKRLDTYKFNYVEELLIKPQFFSNNIYFVLRNYSFVRVQLNKSLSSKIEIKEYSSNFCNIFKNCKESSIKIGQHRFSALCISNQNGYYLYHSSLEDIMKQNKHIFTVNNTIVDYQFSNNDEIGIITVANGVTYFNYYQNILGYKQINFNLSNSVCISNNGINAIINNEQNSSFAINLQTKNSYNIPISIKRCAINNQGNEMIHYYEGILYTYLDGKLWHQSAHLDQINGLSFSEQNILLISDKNFFSYQNIFQIKQDKKQVILSFYPTYKNHHNFIINQRYALVFTPGYIYQEGLYVCQLREGFYEPLYFKDPSYALSFIGIMNNGDVVVTQSNQSYTFIVYSARVKLCSDKQFIKNGDCYSCEQDCNKCQEQTGLCIDYINHYDWIIYLATLSLILFIIILILCLKQKINKGKDRKDNQTAHQQIELRLIKDDQQSQTYLKKSNNQSNQGSISNVKLVNNRNRQIISNNKIAL